MVMMLAPGPTTLHLPSGHTMPSLAGNRFLVPRQYVDALLDAGWTVIARTVH